MDAVEIARILESRNLIAMIVVAMIAGVPVVKGIFAVLMGRHQRRKEFLEFWRDAELRRKQHRLTARSAWKVAAALITGRGNCRHAGSA
jgi:hypothetical protein